MAWWSMGTRPPDEQVLAMHRDAWTHARAHAVMLRRKLWRSRRTCLAMATSASRRTTFDAPTIDEMVRAAGFEARSPARLAMW
jgi:hypothetical protein